MAERTVWPHSMALHPGVGRALHESAGMLESGISCSHDSDEGPRVSKNRTVRHQYDLETLADPRGCVCVCVCDAFRADLKGYRKELQAGHSEVSRAVSLGSRKSKELSRGNAWEKRQSLG